MKDKAQQDVSGGRQNEATVAKAAAFVYAMEGGETYAYKARQALITMPESSSGRPWNQNGWLHDSEALIMYCQAFDMLAGSDYSNFSSSDQNKVLKRIQDFAGSLYWDATTFLWTDYSDNNYKLKIAAALGIAAITHNRAWSTYYDRKKAQKWIDFAMTNIDDLIKNKLTTAEGGYAEGPTYFRYSCVNLLPFFWAYNNFLDGKTEWYKGYRIPSHFNDPRYKKVWDWMVKIRTPLGYSPDFDDANKFCYFYGGMLAGAYKDGVYSWDWINSEVSYYASSTTFLIVDLICSYDDSVSAHRPSWAPTQFLPDAGNAIFRSDWTDRAVYMCLLGEHGKMRKNGLKHEHPDPNSFMIWAYGDPLIIDSGYINFDNHDKVRFAENHNIILVDGDGESSDYDADAYLENYFDTDFLDYCESRTSYRDTNIRRSVIFPHHKYFIVVDDVNSSKTHDYDWLLHGASRQEPGLSFIKETNGGQWINDKAKIRAFVTTDNGAPSISSYVDDNDNGWGKIAKHTVLKARKRDSNTRYLSVLYPSRKGTNFPAIEEINQSQCALLKIGNVSEDNTALAMTKENTDSIEFSSEGFDNIKADAEILFFELDTTLNYPSLIFAKNCSEVFYRGIPCVKSSSRAQFTFNYDYNNKKISGCAKGTSYLSIYTGKGPSGITTVSVGGDGKFSIQGVDLYEIIDSAKPVEHSTTSSDGINSVTRTASSYDGNLVTNKDAITITMEAVDDAALKGYTLHRKYKDKDSGSWSEWEHWNGTGWSSTAEIIPAQGNNSTQYPTTITIQNGVRYLTCYDAHAIDAAGNWDNSVSGVEVRYYFDQPPIEPVLDDAQPLDATGLEVDESVKVLFKVYSVDPDGTEVTYSIFSGPGLIDSNTGIYTWQTGYDDAGTNPVTIRASSGGKYAESTFQLIVNNVSQPPIVVIDSISPDPALVGEMVNFNGSVSDYDGENDISYVMWDFGDRVSNTGGLSYQSITHSYSNAGTYIVVFRAGDRSGAVSEVAQAIMIQAPNQSPTASISAEPLSGKTPLTVHFSNAGSTDPDGEIVSYAWEFGDGNASTEENPAHTYESVATYTVTLTVTDNKGGSDTASIEVTVNSAQDDPPTIDITSPKDGDKVSGTVTIKATAYDDIGIDKVGFFLDDDVSLGTDDSEPYEITYDTTISTNGSHTLKAIAYDSSGQTAEDSVSIIMNNKKSLEDLKYAPGEFIVRFKPGAIQASFVPKGGISVESASFKSLSKSLSTSTQALNRQHQVKKVEHVFVSQSSPLTDIYLLKMSEGSNVETACKDYAKDPNVLYAEPNYIYRTSETIPNEYNSR
ncbi:MAG: PKD domain-containing protein, partial [Candidatus Omnitrophica bacterium]|nr:PKD domain-containing protein [Candidatus Omnitrophota bacterium]